ncbi:hypothetical protein PANT_20c00024 [Moesziomyces antarcticus T-34]|uniref:Uncharacterized protein n=1 Tax=Pseudozyma antarctica (strain T-34) TaxID=1151754 RepID=M9LZ66_PSEA3|nr:hypothetical protein PANT_20c00024 [Moesziomyces antarcticus T-34]
MSTARLSANASTRVFSYSSRSYSSLSARFARNPAASRSSIQSSSSLLATAARSNALASRSASLSFGVQSRLFSSTMTAAAGSYEAACLAGSSGPFFARLGGLAPRLPLPFGRAGLGSF